MDEKIEKKFTHLEYRRAKVVHLVNIQKEEEFIYKGKEISKEEANNIVEAYMQAKADRDNNAAKG